MVELTTTHREGHVRQDARPEVDPPTSERVAGPTITSPGVLTLTRGAGTIQRALIRYLQRTSGNASLQRFLSSPVVRRRGDQSGNGAEDSAVQRQPAPPGPFTAAREGFKAAIGEGPDAHKNALADIQGYAMYSLLPALEKLPPEVRTDEQAGGAAGGPRLVTAMRTVAAKGKRWTDFLSGHNAEIATLPPDQIGDIVTYLGAPKDARYYKSNEFGGRFDGGVDPGAGVVTLYFRVKFEVAPVMIEGTRPGTPEWFKAAQATRDYIATKFGPDFKRVVESTWSGKGTISPACPYGTIKSFQTKVVVTVVDANENQTFFIHPAGAEGRSNAGKEGFGNLKLDDNETKTRTDTVVDPTGKKSEKLRHTHNTSAHEFGHAIGLNHSRCKGDEDICYGVTAEERQDVMGAGDKLQVIKRGGKVLHDDFEPFERIAKRWGQDLLPAKCNTWSAK